MPSITLRPISGTGSNWTNIQNMYDNNNNTFASVTTRSGNFANRTATLNFDSTVIPNGSTINEATLYVVFSTPERYVSTMRVEVNYNSFNGSRVFSGKLISNNKVSTGTSNLTSEMNKQALNKLIITCYTSDSTEKIYNIREVYIEVDYTEGTGIKKNIHLGDKLINKVYLGSTSIKSVYIGDKKVI